MNKSTKNKNNLKVFLGGTCEGWDWRSELVAQLSCTYFNPVVENWTDQCYLEELRQRETCDYVLYVVTPDMHGVYSVAEAVDDSNKRPEKLLFSYVENITKFTKKQKTSLEAVSKMITCNGGRHFQELGDIAEFLNGQTRIYQTFV